MKSAYTLFCLILALVLLPPGLQAQESSVDRLKRISESLESADDWLALVRNLSDPVIREGLRQALAERESYPRQELVALLAHRQLAARLGALELLEQAAGNSYQFNPWAAPPNAETPANDPNLQSLKVWQNWAGLEGEISSTGLTLSEEQLQSYLRDIVSGNPERKRRAIRMLDPHSMTAVAAIQQFISDSPGLPASSTIGLKEAQYQLVINQTSPKTAAVVARDLTRGNRDQKLSALSGLKKVGFLAIPIVRDFIDSSDALVRETAIDTILALGGSQTVPLIAPSLKTEKDINVIHAAMRRLREIGGQDAKDLAIFYLDHESEDMVVSALQTATKLWGGDGYSGFADRKPTSSKPNQATVKATELLKDPRWRIRTAALEFISKTRARSAETEVISLLADEDTFVRANAIEAVVSLDLKSAIPALKDLFLNDDEMIGAITSALTSLETVLPDPLIAHLDTRSPDAIIAAIKGLSSDKEPYLKIVARYAKHPNLDVSCTALRALGSDSDNIRRDFVSDHLNEALQSGIDEKITAVLNSVRFPGPQNSGFSSSYRMILPPSKPTTLDHLYEAFLNTKSKKDEAKPSPAEKPNASGGKDGLRDTLAAIARDWKGNPERAYRCAFILAKADDSDGLEILTNNFDQLSTSQRSAIADNLYSPNNDNAIPLITLLLQDELSEVRSDAAYTAFGSSNKPELTDAALTALTEEGSQFMAHEAYGYRLESALTDSRTGGKLVDWARDLLTSEAREDNKILALVILRKSLRESDDRMIAGYTNSENQWLRRAAWHALCKSRIPYVLKNVEKLKNDPAPQVRIALPMSLAAEASQLWNHQFSDLHSTKSISSSYYSSSPRSFRQTVPQAILDVIRSLAESDPDSQVRFESWFTLLSQRREIDLKTFLALIGEQPQSSSVPERLANHLERNYQGMGKAMRPLLAFANTKAISARKLPAILQHFATDTGGASFTSFAALAKSTATNGGPQQIADAETPEELAAKRKYLKVIAFYKPGCRECEKAENNLAELKRNFPLLTIERLNILDQKGLLINQALCARLQVSGVGKTPSFFTQAGAAVSPQVQPEQLADLLRMTMETKDNPAWADFNQVEIEEAKEQIDEKFSKTTLAIVVVGGLLDGVNPCAFATIIFFLSYLQVAKRSPREILMVGVAFILAIFLAYFSVGVLFYKMIASLVELESFQLIRDIMTWTFAGFAFLVAVLSLRDGIRASRGNLKEMTLQLPDFLKNRIRGTIRKRARARNYVIAAFITGIIISFLELACTGQVYAPIVYQVQQGRSDALLFLFIYNVAFILPLVIIFALAYRGMTSETLLNFQKTHTAFVKFATAILFFLLTFVILFGEKFLPHA